MANFFLAFLLYSQGNCGILRNETRLVVMPELQGRGIGPKMAEIQGDGIGPKIQGYLWCTTESVRQFLGDEYINGGKTGDYTWSTVRLTEDHRPRSSTNRPSQFWDEPLQPRMFDIHLPGCSFQSPTPRFQ